MRERPRHRLVWAVILSAAGLAAIPGCDNTVNIKTLTLRLRNIYPVGASYTNDAGEPGATCEINQGSFDLKLLLLGMWVLALFYWPQGVRRVEAMALWKLGMLMLGLWLVGIGAQGFLARSRPSEEELLEADAAEQE